MKGLEEDELARAQSHSTPTRETLREGGHKGSQTKQSTRSKTNPEVIPKKQVSKTCKIRRGGFKS